MNDVFTNFFLWLYALEGLALTTVIVLPISVGLIAIGSWGLYTSKDRPPMTDAEFMSFSFAALGIFVVFYLVVLTAANVLGVLNTPSESSDIFYLGKLWYY